MLYLLCLAVVICGSNSFSLQPVEKTKQPVEKVKQPVEKAKLAVQSNTPVMHAKDLLANIKADPEQFISQVENLDPVALRNILTLLESLVATSESRENDLIDALNRKINQLDAASNDVADAEDSLTDANQAVTNADNSLTQIRQESALAITNAENVLAQKEQDAVQAQSHLDGKKLVHQEKVKERDGAKNEHDAEIPSLNDEQKILTDVINMLEDLHKKNRHLTDFALRLSSYPRGRLQLYRISDSAWHTVCGHYFWSSIADPGVAVCKKLNYPDGGTLHRMKESGQTIDDSDPIYISRCAAGEVPGHCTVPGCCSFGCKQYEINCGDCERGTDAVIEIECFGQRQD